MAPSALSNLAFSRQSAVGVSGLIALALVIRNAGDKFSGGSKKGAVGKAKKKKVAVDGVFAKRMLRLLKIIVPGPMSGEAFYLAFVAALLVVRTYFDLLMLGITTQVESRIIARDSKGFAKGVGRFFMWMLPVAACNSFLKYGQAELALRFRERLTAHLYDQYLKGFTYYKVSNLDNRISNADQLLTQDVERFCQSVADLYSNISKPLLDIAIYARRLTSSIGVMGPISMLSYLVGSGFVLTWLRRPTGRFTVTEQQLEGEYRYINSRLITHSEEVAFYNGNDRERSVVSSSFARLIRMARRSQQFRYSVAVIDNIVAKYSATLVGFTVVSRPFLDLDDPRHKNSSYSELMEDYYKSGRMMINLAGAMGRLVLAGRELTRLAGFTERVTELLNVLQEVNAGTYKRTMLGGEGGSGEEGEGAAKSASALGLKPGSGVLEEQDGVIEFTDVPLVTPNGDVLVRALSFKVTSGCNVVVCGPNGCGKSSLFRTLGELWPLFGGHMVKPNKEKLFYIPQRPYLALGTLRDQIIYPHSKERMAADGRSDDDLQEFLEDVRLGYLVSREGGWDAVKDWADVLSGGEKQRVAMARLFYHRPQFAILDECTSAVSVDVEGFMYRHCREQGITLFTVSHRKSLWKYHEYVLRFDGKGAYQFAPITDMDDDVFGS